MLHTGRGPADRTGGECARGTQYKTSIPFAAIPHDIAADPRLSPTDLRVLAALFYFARADPSCWPCDNSLAARVHRHPGTVRRCLKRLENLGYIRREFVQATPANPTGRLIHLTCTESDWPRPVSDTPERRRTPTPCADERTPRAPAHTDREVVLENQRNVTSFEPDLGAALPASTVPLVRPTPPQVAFVPATPAPGPAPPAAPPRPLKEELKSLLGAGPDRVRTLAWRLAHFLCDQASIGFFVMVLTMVSTGAASVERLLAAYQAGERSRNSARRPGSIFCSVWSGWQPPLKPSEINRPKYYQAPSQPVVRASPSPAPVPEAPAELSREEELAQLRSWLDQPRHPFAGIARRRLAELGELGVAT